MILRHFILILLLTSNLSVFATDYHVGPEQTYTNISDVPWESIVAGDRVYIHWRSTPYNEKWVINASGTASNPIEIMGITGNGGEKPIIDGNNATTRTALDYWNENRGVIKIGASSVPSNAIASYITIENLEIRSARPPYQFTDDNGNTDTYNNNAASIYIELGQHITIRNCTIRDSGNGIFVGANNGLTQDILITNNYIYDNGISGSIFEHNSYTEALGITYEFNRFGALRTDAGGNNLKDRSAGLVVRYNWIEGGNRQLDLVESDDDALLTDPSYHTTYAYGNILIEPDGAGNSQIIHYGGDSGTTSNYRKGDFYFYNNTVISTRSGFTTLARLSTEDETMHAFNNAIYGTANGSNLALLNLDGTINIQNNWIKTGWVNSHEGGTFMGTVNDLGDNLTGNDPLFTDFANEDFSLLDTSNLINSGIAIPPIHIPDHDLVYEYLIHSNGAPKNIIEGIDIGAFEYQSPLSVNDLALDDVQIYPNPAKHVLHIKMDKAKIKNTTLFSILGKKVLTTKNNTTLNIANLRPGIYILKLETIYGVIINKKFIKN